PPPSLFSRPGGGPHAPPSFRNVVARRPCSTRHNPDYRKSVIGLINCRCDGLPVATVPRGELFRDRLGLYCHHAILSHQRQMGETVVARTRRRRWLREDLYAAPPPVGRFLQGGAVGLPSGHEVSSRLAV